MADDPGSFIKAAFGFATSLIASGLGVEILACEARTTGSKRRKNSLVFIDPSNLEQNLADVRFTPAYGKAFTKSLSHGTLEMKAPSPVRSPGWPPSLMTA